METKELLQIKQTSSDSMANKLFAFIDAGQYINSRKVKQQIRSLNKRMNTVKCGAEVFAKDLAEVEKVERVIAKLNGQKDGIERAMKYAETKNRLICL